MQPLAEQYFVIQRFISNFALKIIAKPLKSQRHSPKIGRIHAHCVMPNGMGLIYEHKTNVMKKTIYAIALAAVMFMTSASSQNVVGTNKGAFAPQLSISNNTHDISLDQFRGKYVVLTFWSSADADSRVQCGKYDTWTSQNPQSDVCHVSVNFDSNPELFAEIANLDGLDAKMQFNVQGQQAKEIKKDFHLVNGYGSFLIGPDGKVCEINPSISLLASL